MVSEDYYYGGYGIIGKTIVSFVRQIVTILWPYVTATRGLVLVITIQLLAFVLLYYILPWILCKQVVTDVCLLLSVPFYLAMSVNLFGSIWDYWQYEKMNLEYGFQKKGFHSHLEVWYDVKYYPYVNKEDCEHIYCYVGTYSVDSLENKSLEVGAVLEGGKQQ